MSKMSTDWKVVIGVIVTAMVGIGLLILGNYWNVATPTQIAPQPTFTAMPDALIYSTTIPAPLAGEMTATLIQSVTVTTTVTTEQMAALIQERAESGEIGDDDNGPPAGLTMRDFDINVTDEHIELTGQASSSSFGDLDFHVIGVPMVEDGELNFHVTAATVNGIPLTRSMIPRMEGGFDQMLLQSLPGGYEVQKVILSDGLITLVTLQ